MEPIWLLVAVVGAVAGVALFFAIRSSKTPDSTPLLLLQEQLSAFRQELGLQTHNFHKLVDENLHKNLSLMQKSQETVGERFDRVIGEVQNRLGKMEEANQRIFEVGKDISSLQEILKAPKLRGSLGEFFLGDLLAQIMPAKNFTMQYRFKNGETVDAVVELGGRYVSIDSKFPLENFRKFVDADTEQERKNAKRLFRTDVKKHVDAIASKYIHPDECTFDFALMYIPAENVYYETIIKEDDFGGEKALCDYAMSKRVIPVSPNNFYAYLQTILLGLRGFKVEEYAHQIMANIQQLKGDFNRFTEDFAKLGTHLNHARGSYEQADKRLARFQNKLESVELPIEQQESPRLKAVPDATLEKVSL